MSTGVSHRASHWDDLRVVFDGFAKRVSSQITGLTWSTESHPSNVYSFIGLLAISRISDPENELIVVTMECRSDGSAEEWSLDITGPRSIALAEMPRQVIVGSDDVRLALGAVGEFLGHHVDDALRVLHE